MGKKSRPPPTVFIRAVNPPPEGFSAASIPSDLTFSDAKRENRLTVERNVTDSAQLLEGENELIVRVRGIGHLPFEGRISGKNGSELIAIMVEDSLQDYEEEYEKYDEEPEDGDDF